MPITSYESYKGEDHPDFEREPMKITTQQEALELLLNEWGLFLPREKWMQPQMVQFSGSRRPLHRGSAKLLQRYIRHGDRLFTAVTEEATGTTYMLTAAGEEWAKTRLGG